MKTLTSTQQFDYILEPKDRKGNPATVDGVPVWTNSNPNVGDLNVSADGLSATFVAKVPGTTTVSVTADADLGAGVQSIAGAEDVVVTPAAAITIELKSSDPVEQA